MHLLVIAVAVSENTPTPLTLAPATLTLYCMATWRPVKVVLVTWGLSWVTRDPVGESSRIQLVMGAVVSGVMTGGWGEGGGGGEARGWGKLVPCNTHII